MVVDSKVVLQRCRPDAEGLWVYWVWVAKIGNETLTNNSESEVGESRGYRRGEVAIHNVIDV